MGISSVCEIKDCENAPLIFCAGVWICGECMVKWNKSQNLITKRRMEEVINGS